MTIDTSRIENLAFREKVKANWEKRKVLAAAVDAAEAPFLEEIRAMWRRRMDERDALDARYRAAREEVDQRAKAACAEQNKALDAFDEADTSASDDISDVDWNEDGEPQFCCVSGVVLLDGDELVEDSEGRKALAAVLAGWPGFEEADEDGDGDDTADAEDEAAWRQLRGLRADGLVIPEVA